MNFSHVLYKPYYYLMKSLGYDYQIRRFIHNHTDKNLPIESILEVGCGTGAAGLCLSNIYSQAAVLFTDNNTVLIKKLELRTSHKKAISLGISDISCPENVTLLSGKTFHLANESYDIIFAGANIGYSASPDTTISKLYNILKPGGSIVDLEMRTELLGKIISNAYSYKPITQQHIKFSLRSKEAIIKSKKISWSYFPLNLTRTHIVITKPYSGTVKKKTRARFLANFKFETAEATDVSKSTMLSRIL